MPPSKYYHHLARGAVGTCVEAGTISPWYKLVPSQHVGPVPAVPRVASTSRSPWYKLVPPPCLLGLGLVQTHPHAAHHWYKLGTNSSARRPSLVQTQYHLARIESALGRRPGPIGIAILLAAIEVSRSRMEFPPLGSFPYAYLYLYSAAGSLFTAHERHMAHPPGGPGLELCEADLPLWPWSCARPQEDAPDRNRRPRTTVQWYIGLRRHVH